MNDAVQQLLEEFSSPSKQAFINLIDIFLVAYLIYRLFMLVRGTRAWRIVGGAFIFVVLLFASNELGLRTLHWVLEKATVLAPVAIVILLLPELRHAIESFGKLGFWPQKFVGADSHTEVRTVEEIVAAVAEMAAASVGALIVIEKGPPLADIVDTGVNIDAKVSAPLLGALFYHGNPLHDGAVVVRGDTIIAAACRLPLSESSRLDQNVHMRHRAAVGVTEGHDCLTIAVSEERGTISVSSEGRLRRLANHLELREMLNRELRNVMDSDESASAKKRKRRRRSKVGTQK